MQKNEEFLVLVEIQMFTRCIKLRKMFGFIDIYMRNFLGIREGIHLFLLFFNPFETISTEVSNEETIKGMQYNNY